MRVPADSRARWAPSVFVLTAFFVVFPPRVILARSAEGVLLLDLSSARVESKLRRQVLGGLRNTLRSGGFRVAVRTKAGGAQTDGRIDALLTRAKTHSERFEEDEALAALDRAEELWRAGFGESPRVKPLMRVLLARVKLTADAGKRDALQKTLLRALVLDPELTLDPGLYPPQVMAAVKQLGARVNERQSTLEVTSAPPGFPVLVDGRPRGAAPVTVKVPLGEHFVAVGPRGARVGKVVRVGSGGASVAVAVRQRARRLSDPRLRETGQRAGASWVVTVRVVPLRGGKLQVRTRAIASRTVDVPRTLRSPAVEQARLVWATSALAVKLQQALRGRVARTGTSPITPPSGDDDDGSILKSWWFWTLVGVVAGGGAATAVVLTRDNDPGVRVTVQR